MHTVIVEDQSQGHRLYYVRLLADRALRRGDSVSLLLGEQVISSPEFATHLAGAVSNLNVELRGALPPKTVMQAALSKNADHIVIPDADSDLLWLAFAPRRSSHATISALIMRDATGPSRIYGLQKIRTLLKHLCIRVADSRRNTSMFVLRSAMWNGVSDLPHARDPITLCVSRSESLATAKEWGLDPSRYWFGVLGKVSARKNLPLIVAALDSLESRPIGLLVAGQCDADVAEFLEQLSFKCETKIKLIVLDRQLSETELDSAVQFIDCLVAAHSNEGPSGLLGKAAAAGTRIVAAGATSLKMDCEFLSEARAIWSPLEKASLSATFSKAINMSRPSEPFAASAEQFAEVLL